MCNVVLAGSNREFEYLNNVVVLSDRIDVYDYQDKLIMTLPQGKQERNEFEILCYALLSSIEDSFLFDSSNDVSERVLWTSFYDPKIFPQEMKYCCDSLEESLKK